MSVTVGGGGISIRNGSRIVFTTEGTLVNLLPPQYDIEGGALLPFPDVLKTKVYMHEWLTTRESPPGDPGGDRVWVRGSRCVVQVGARPQEWSDTTVLARLPAGVDFVALMVTMYRIQAPSHTWCGKPVAVLPVQGQTIPYTGSVLLESGDPGFLRAASIYVSGRDLILHQQQSVSMPPGGFGSKSGSDGPAQEYWGKDWRPDPNPGIPVWAPTGSPGRRNAISVGAPGSIIRPPPLRTCDLGGAQECTLTDPTNYRSGWDFQFTAKFGRRSLAQG